MRFQLVLGPSINIGLTELVSIKCYVWNLKGP